MGVGRLDDGVEGKKENGPEIRDSFLREIGAERRAHPEKRQSGQQNRDEIGGVEIDLFVVAIMNLKSIGYQGQRKKTEELVVLVLDGNGKCEKEKENGGEDRFFSKHKRRI